MMTVACKCSKAADEPWLALFVWAGKLSSQVKGVFGMVQALQNIPEAPQLPASYPVMMILALCPPLFSHIMDPRAMAYSDKTVNK